MRPPGTFKLLGRARRKRDAGASAMDPMALCAGRGDRIVDSLRVQILEGPEAQAIDRRIRSHFGRARSIKTQATRKGSAERYLLARDFSG